MTPCAQFGKFNWTNARDLDLNLALRSQLLLVIRLRTHTKRLEAGFGIAYWTNNIGFLAAVGATAFLYQKHFLSLQFWQGWARAPSAGPRSYIPDCPLWQLLSYSKKIDNTL